MISSRSMSTTGPRIAFIGGGNMARSLIGGLLGQQEAGYRIAVGEPSPEQRAALEADFGVECHADNDAAVRGADSVILAVKPQVIADVTRGLADAVEPSMLVISIAAGIRSGDISTWLGGHTTLVRAMPNTPALLRCGITALYAGPGVDAARRGFAQELLAAAGETVWVDDESLMDAVTAVSGSGPAYLFLLLEALEAAARNEGLPAATARQLAVHTMLGAARMAAEGESDPAELRRRVTSPGGTTQAALEVLETGELRELVARAVAAAARRGAELAEEAGKQ